jgi:hypothetical protein
MKEFDLTEIRAARTMSEANFFLDRHKGVATRQEIHASRKERWKTFFNRVVLKEGRL